MHNQLLRRIAIFAFLTAFSFYLIQNTVAQAGQAELTGEVRDQTGAVIFNAKVILTEVATNHVHTSTTATSGVYTFINIKPGLYIVIVEAEGFKRFVREAVQLA